MQTETMLWLCNFKQKKKTTSVVLKQRNINKRTNSLASSLSVIPHRLQSNVSHRLQSYTSHRLQSHDSQFMLSGSSTKKKSSRPETLAGTSMAKKIPFIDCNVDADSGRYAKIQLSPNQRVLTIADFLQHIDVNDRQDVLDLLDQQEQSTADDELLQRRFEQTTAVLRQECPDRDPDYLVKPSGKLSDPQAHLLNYPIFSISQRRDRRSQQCLHLYRRTSDGGS
ncbi:hypothetical protein D6D02_08367 [Aureobasidium pullulans]|nr:hypothetical protein D6D03_06602 [Aureobasidium pullulans]THY02610.1 hypothetical protein D6D02_08367 [Aureobasidium pullulans]